jgi:RecA-family ATPase
MKEREGEHGEQYHSEQHEPGERVNSGTERSAAQKLLDKAKSLNVLEHMIFDPIKHVVPGILIEGLTLFAGKPKAGKSWLMLDIAIAVANSGFTLGDLHCIQGDVLYCALEDSERRLQSRARKLSLGFPERVTCVTEMPRLSAGGLDLIRAWIAAHPEARLVIIDTLAMVREGRKREDTTYDADYHAVLELRKLANDLKIAIVVLHHLRKADSDDVFDTISGTLGLTGAPDTILVLKYDGRISYTLHGKGRDLIDFEKALTFDRQSCRWRIVGEAAEVKRSAERNAILEAIREAGEPIGPGVIAAETGMRVVNVKKLVAKLFKEGAIEKPSYGHYSVRRADGQLPLEAASNAAAAPEPVVIGDCPEGTVCLQCGEAGDVKKIKPNVPGAKTETLHAGCAAIWFRS